MHDGPAQSAESVCVEVMRRMIVLTIPEDEVAVLVARRVVQALPPEALRRPSPREQFVDPLRGLTLREGWPADVTSADRQHLHHTHGHPLLGATLRATVCLGSV